MTIILEILMLLLLITKLLLLLLLLLLLMMMIKVWGIVCRQVESQRVHDVPQHLPEDMHRLRGMVQPDIHHHRVTGPNEVFEDRVMHRGVGRCRCPCPCSRGVCRLVGGV